MRRKIRRSSIVILAACALFAVPLLYFIRQNTTESARTLLAAKAALPDGQEKASYPLPVRLKIPKIGVDSAFEYVGLAPDGRMDVPKGPADVAWFELGQRPGEPGSAVVAGHSGYKDDKPGAFDDLYKLEKGDKIYVEDEKGKTITFVVRDFHSYGKNEDASNVFGADDQSSHLNLVTCTGDWNEVEKTHSDRLVVFADKEI